MFGFGKSEEKKRAVAAKLKRDSVLRAENFVQNIKNRADYELTELGQSAIERIDSSCADDSVSAADLDHLVNSFTNNTDSYIKIFNVNRQLDISGLDVRKLYHAMETQKYDDDVWLALTKKLNGMTVSALQHAELWYAVNHIRSKFDQDTKHYPSKHAPELATDDNKAFRLVFSALTGYDPDSGESAENVFGTDSLMGLKFHYLTASHSSLRKIIEHRYSALADNSTEPDGPETTYLRLNNLVDNNPTLDDQEILKISAYMLMSLELRLSGEDFDGALADLSGSDSMYDNVDREEIADEIATLSEFILEFISPGSLENIREALVSEGTEGDYRGDILTYGISDIMNELRSVLSDVKIRLIKRPDDAETTNSDSKNTVSERILEIQSLLNDGLITEVEFQEKKNSILSEI